MKVVIKNNSEHIFATIGWLIENVADQDWKIIQDEALARYDQLRIWDAKQWRDYFLQHEEEIKSGEIYKECIWASFVFTNKDDAMRFKLMWG